MPITVVIQNPGKEQVTLVRGDVWRELQLFCVDWQTERGRICIGPFEESRLINIGVPVYIRIEVQIIVRGYRDRPVDLVVVD